MIVFPHAKVNLGLHVISKRGDGFHELETVFYPVPWCDALEIVPSKNNKTEFSSSGLPIPLSSGGNLVMRAVDELRKRFTLPELEIHLHKVIPMGAGLGGGSSDAAFTLRLLNDSFGLGLDSHELGCIAAQLGSDCAFFAMDVAMLASGRGEVLKPIQVPLDGWFMVLVMPPVSVGTAEAYSWIKPQKPSQDLESLIAKGPEAWKGKLSNDFENPVCERYPIIAQIREQLYELGAVYAAMSGSGAAVFGLFSKAFELPPALKQLPHWCGILTSKL